jgi:hypothetical protein
VLSLPLALFPVKSGSASGDCSSAHEPTGDLNSAVRVRSGTTSTSTGSHTHHLCFDRQIRGFRWYLDESHLYVLMFLFRHHSWYSFSVVYCHAIHSAAKCMFVAHKKRLYTASEAGPWYAAPALVSSKKAHWKSGNWGHHGWSEVWGNRMRSPR